jgi:hypothetical protein
VAGAHPRAVPAGEPDGHGCPEAADRGWWWQRFERELERDPAGEPTAAVSGGGQRRVLEARGGSAVARIAELRSSGAGVLVLAADAGRRAALAAAVDLAGAPGVTVCLRCPPAELAGAAEAAAGSLLLTDWRSLAGCPEVAAEFEHVVAVDPPAGAGERAMAMRGDGFLHRAWGSNDDLAERCWDAEWELRAALAEIYRSLVPARLEDEALREALVGAGRYGRTPEAAARCTRVLGELGIAGFGSQGGSRWIGVVSSERTELDRSGAWRAYRRTHEEGRRFLQSLRTEH